MRQVFLVWLFILFSVLLGTPAHAQWVGQYFVTPPTFNDRQAVPLNTDQNGKLVLSPTSPSGSLSPTISANTSSFSRPANTTAYAGTVSVPQLIASSVTAGSVIVPSFQISATSSQAVVPSVVLNTNVTTGWNNVSLLINVWIAAPTYSTGDGATYTVATGAASWRAQYSCTLVQYADGATCLGNSIYTNNPIIRPAAGSTVYWDVQIQSSATPISGQTFNLTVDIFN